MFLFGSESKTAATVAADPAGAGTDLVYASGMWVDSKSSLGGKPRPDMTEAYGKVQPNLMTRAALKSSFGNKTYTFRLSASSDLITTAGGVLLSFVPLSPAVITYNEWAGLSALFDEVKLVSSTITCRPLVGSDGQALGLAAATKVFNNDVWFGFDNTNISTAPASYASVIRLDGSSPLQRTVADSGRSKMTIKARSRLDWASTLTPAVSSPPAGVLGSFNFAAASSLSNSTIYTYIVLHTIVKMRCRI